MSASIFGRTVFTSKSKKVFQASVQLRFLASGKSSILSITVVMKLATIAPQFWTPVCRGTEANWTSDLSENVLPWRLPIALRKSSMKITMFFRRGEQFSIVLGSSNPKGSRIVASKRFARSLWLTRMAIKCPFSESRPAKYLCWIAPLKRFSDPRRRGQHPADSRGIPNFWRFSTERPLYLDTSIINRTGIQESLSCLQFSNQNLDKIVSTIGEEIWTPGLKEA